MNANPEGHCEDLSHARSPASPPLSVYESERRNMTATTYAAQAVELTRHAAKAIATAATHAKNKAYNTAKGAYESIRGWVV